jgi:hypothetical protein
MRLTAAPFEKPIGRFFQKQRVRSLLAPFILVWPLLICAFATSAQSPASSQNVPQATLTAFYHWYLEALADSRDPLHDDRAKIEGYVSKGLLRGIDRRSKSAEGLDEDYFIRAQDYLEDWASNIAVSDVQIKDGTASAKVTLGATKQSRYPLAVNLIKEGDAWKTSKVSAGHI